MVALGLVRELGPVMAALLFASRAGSAMTAEIGLMKATEQISADGNDGGESDRHGIVAPRFWAGVISMPLLAALFSVVGIYGGYLSRGANRRGRRFLLVANAGAEIFARTY